MLITFFVLWSGSEIELEQFNAFLNSIHDLLEFSITKNWEEISFPDVKIKMMIYLTPLFSQETLK